jgi:signal-transduction protein with cAMP-binding, CBS, and nucleotidyltransferase domain
MMFRYRVSGLPVVDPDGHVLGIITEGDFLAMELKRADGGDTAEFVSEAMSHSVLSISPDLEVMEAARFMQQNDVKRLVVVEDSTMTGIISRFDIVAGFTRPDDLIEDEIREDLIRRVLFVDPQTVDVTVANGIVTLFGKIGTRTEVRLMEELTRRLDGVVDVENQLEWRIDDTSSADQ